MNDDQDLNAPTPASAPGDDAEENKDEVDDLDGAAGTGSDDLDGEESVDAK